MVGFTDPVEAIPMEYYPAPDDNNKHNSHTNTPGLPPLSPRTAEQQEEAAARMSNNRDVPMAPSYTDDDEEETDAEDKESVKRWDEGGDSDCGYSTNIHETLMSVGAKVHEFVGAPSMKVHKLQDAIGNWFQELSYATRDILRGENTDEMQKDASDAVSTLFYGQDETNIDEKKVDDEQTNGCAALGVQRDAELL
ncbi:hypothetical protein MPSEU_000908000 [Mayamaea pseudoterrestris]|nr:hypothetical protein MPSEU_000908000 [Mayamaea pseudoterrestris]